MFCQKCGTGIPAGQQFCPNCGTPVVFAPQAGNAAPYAPTSPVARFRVARNLQIIAALWAVRGLFAFLGWLIALPFIAGAFGGFGHVFTYQGPWMGGHWGGAWWVPFVTVMVVIRGVLDLTAAYGLWTRQPWGRVFAIVVAFLALLSVPFGTALGIYTLVILLPATAAVEYGMLSRTY